MKATTSNHPSLPHSTSSSIYKEGSWINKGLQIAVTPLVIHSCNMTTSHFMGLVSEVLLQGEQLICWRFAHCYNPRIHSCKYN